MANLYYNDGEGNMIQLANINSPMLTGNPITPTPSGKKNTQLVNVGYLKSYVSDKIKKYEFEYDDIQDYTISVTPLLKYMVSVYGVINSYSTTDQKKIGYVVVTDENDNILAKSASSVSALNLQQGYFPQSATMYVQAPPSGIFRAYVNYGGTDGKIKAQYILVVKADVTRTYKVNIIQSPNQTIEVIYNGVAFTESFEIVEGANYQVRITPHTGYNAGTLSTTGGTIAGEDVEISATTAIKKKFTVNITQSAHQTIHVKHNGIDKTSTFITEYGDEIEISISPDTGYNAGTVNPKGKITVSNNVSISATTAEIKKFTVSAQQFTEQTITMTRKDTNATTTTSWTNVPYNTQVTATIALKNDYKNSHTVGSLTASSKTITANYNFTATSATWKTYKLTIPKQSKQKITVKYTEPGASEKSLVSTETAAKSITVKHGTTWKASIVSLDSNYNAGTLTPGTTGTVTAATTVSATAATVKDVVVTFTKVNNPKFRVTYTNGSNVSTSVDNPASIRIKKGTTFTIIQTEYDLVKHRPTGGYWNDHSITFHYKSFIIIDKNGTPIFILYKTSDYDMLLAYNDYDLNQLYDLRNSGARGTSWTSPSISSNTTYKIFHANKRYTSNSSSDYNEHSSGEGDGAPGDGDSGHGGGGGDF